MHFISRLVHTDNIPELPVFLDSPMAVDVTEMFRKHRDSYDQETWDLISSGTAPLRFPRLQMTRATSESKQINDIQGPCIIMATSGMCTAGHIKHHLRQNINLPESTILFVGFQAHGTLGRRILDRDEEVRIHGRNYPVRAHVSQIYGLSGHADKTDLLHWLNHF